MRLASTTLAMPAILAAALTLGACGDMVDKEGMYAEFESTCKTSFVSEGGPAEMAEPFCACSTKKVREQDLGPMELLDEQKMTEIAEECVGSLMPAAPAN